MFSWQEQYLTRSLRSLVRYCSCHSNIKSISSRNRVISSMNHHALNRDDGSHLPQEYLGNWKEFKSEHLGLFITQTELYENLLSKAKLPSLRNRRLQDILVLMYKVKNSMVPKNVHEVFLKQDKNYNLRSCDFPIPRVNTCPQNMASTVYDTQALIFGEN